MKKYLKENVVNFIAFIYALLNALFFLAERINYAGITKAIYGPLESLTKISDLEHNLDKLPKFLYFLANYLPVIVLLGMIVVLVFATINLLTKKEKKGSRITIFVFNGIFSIGIIALIILGSWDYMDFILPHFLLSLVIAILILLLAFVLFFPIENTKKGIIAKSSILTIVTLTAIILGFGIKINYFTYDSVVYAVEDNYQIVFSTNDESLAWVEIGDEKFYDLYTGSMRSSDNVHKIIVPQEKLDNKKEYTIKAEHMLYRGPFGAFKGNIISKTHSFTPVDDDNDGKFNYYALSDVHGSFNGAVNAALNAGDLDFLVMIGDMSSMVETEYYANYNNKLASKITKGEYPVVYTRGNHEIKGLYAEELYKYVGSLNENFYYYFKLGKNSQIKGVTLDLAEDHDDGWWEYYESDQFDLYRREQTEYLANLKNNGYFGTDSYNMVICHVPITYINSRGDHTPFKIVWTDILNDMNISVGLYGHQHDLNVFNPLTDQELMLNGEKIDTLIDSSEDYNAAIDRIYSSINGKEHRSDYLVDSVLGDLKVYDMARDSRFYSKPGLKYAYESHLTNYNFYSFMVGRYFDDAASDDNLPVHFGSNKYTGMLMKVNGSTQEFLFTNSKGDIVTCYPMFKVWEEGEGGSSKPSAREDIDKVYDGKDSHNVINTKYN